MRRSAILLTAVFLILAGGIASAQQTEISASVIDVYTNHVSGLGLQETATDSGGALISYRHFAQQHNGLEVNWSFTKNTQRYSDLAGVSVTSVQSKIQELTTAYVFHITRGSFQPFALAGAGFLMFSPTNYAVNAADPAVSRQIRPAFLYGVGVDYRLRKGLAVRAQYRSLVYESPDFFGGAVALHTSTAMQMREPCIGLIYRF